ncbi:MAG: hypothetical protein AAGH15_25360 [Myxococcota bacterium]
MSGRLAVVVALVGGCVLDLPPPLEPDGCDGPPVPCGTRCIPPEDVCAPTDFAGRYSVTVRSGTNACELEGWMEGSVVDAPVSVTQDGTDLSLRVEGIAGFLLALDFFAEPVFVGTVEGDTFEARSATTRQLTEGGCAWRNAPSIRAEATGENTVEGVLEYRIEANGHPDCPPFFDECVSTQSLVASRPPPVP